MWGRLDVKMESTQIDRRRFSLGGTLTSQAWLRLWVSAAVALAFADASIVVLGLPQIVDRLHTSISHVTWVITAYNAALILGSVSVVVAARRLRFTHALIAGLLLFGSASIGSGLSNSLKVLVFFRVLQGLGGALLLCGSLPRLAGATRAGEPPLGLWAAAAAIGAALGPAAGGILTEVFDWRAIFLAQAPVAALAALAIWRSPGADAQQAFEADSAELAAVIEGSDRRALAPRTANVALVFLSAGLIGALFLITVLLINVWGLTPLGAAAMLTALPLSTAIAERVTHGRSPVRSGTVGSVTLAVGLTILALLSHRQLVPALLGLALCGTGLGLSFPALTDTALGGRGQLLARVARTIAARDAGLVLGLLILTPVFVDQLKAAPGRALPPIAKSIFSAPMSNNLKLQLGAGLLAANASAPQAQLPDFRPAFTNVSKKATPPTRLVLTRIQAYVHSVVERAATKSFQKPLLYCAIFALLVLPLLLLRLPGPKPAAVRVDSRG